MDRESGIRSRLRSKFIADADDIFKGVIVMVGTTITKVTARQVFSGRGHPAVEATVSFPVS